MPPVPHPPEAAMRAMSAGAVKSGALLRAGSRGTPSGSGGGGGLVKGHVGMVGASGAATGAASQAPLRGAGSGGGGHHPWPGCRMPSPPAQCSARPGAEHLALGGENSPPPPTGSSRCPSGGGGRPVRAESLSGSGLMGPGGQLNCPPPTLPPARAPPVPPRPQAPPSTAELGDAHPMCEVFSLISCALTATRATPPPPPTAPSINESMGRLKSWTLCNGLSEGVMGQGLAPPPPPLPPPTLGAAARQKDRVPRVKCLPPLPSHGLDLGSRKALCVP